MDFLGLPEGITLEVKGPSFLYSSSLHGVKPLLDLLEEGRDVRGSSLTDRVSGKAAALLYVKLRVSSVRTGLISENALSFLLDHGISVLYEKKIPYILNHARTDLCPLEKATLLIEDADEGIAAIKKTIRELQAKS
jgi:hypothetical protein